jgi:iron uptake system component EfeO
VKQTEKCCSRRINLAATVSVLVLAIIGCSSTATNKADSSDVDKIAVTVTDKGCQPLQLTVTPGKSTFVVTNKSSQVLEWEILKAGKVVEEQENIVPGFVQEVKAKLEPGQYDMTCGLRSNPKGAIAVNPK